MSATATKAATPWRLNVAIHANDSTRRAALSKLVVDAGHIATGNEDEANVALCDVDCPPANALPRVTLGSSYDHSQSTLPRDASIAQIDAAVRAVAAGLVVRSPNPADTGFRPMHEHDGRTLLTPREIEILGTMADGMSNKSIARHLNISLHTVKFHVESVFRKLDVHSRTEAVAKALERRRHETITL